MQIGELWLVNYPYEDSDDKKYRPALVILGEDESGNLKCAKITGSIWRKTEDDFIIIDWQQANLTKESLAELKRVELIHKSEFRKRIGELSTDDLITLYSKIV